MTAEKALANAAMITSSSPASCTSTERCLAAAGFTAANTINKPSTSAGNSNLGCTASRLGTDICKPTAANTASATGHSGSPSDGRTHSG